VTDENFKDMVIAHDKDISTLATSIETLASNVGATNNRLSEVIDIMNQQSVLVERMNNMDHNVTESFKRAWGRLEKLEVMAETNGCNIARGLDKEKDVFTEKIKVINNRLHDVEINTSTFWSGAAPKWILGLLVSYSITFGTYVVTSLHKTETVLATYIAKDTESRSTITHRLDDIVLIMRDQSRRNILTRSTQVGPTVDTAGDF